MIVWDAEPIVAYLADEPGADIVESYLEQTASGDVHSIINPVQFTEIKYITEQIGGSEYEKQFWDFYNRLGMHRVEIADTRNMWQQAAKYKLEGHSLGDAYLLATAEIATREPVSVSVSEEDKERGESAGSTVKLLVGADSDFDDVSISGVTIERFRDEPA